jgi:haloalkane dehalogenase
LTSSFVEVEGLRLHYLAAGRGAPVLLLHGWPTSSFLWRNIMPAIAEHRRVIALDLPGFGRSDKPLDASYSFRFFNRAIDGFVDALNIERLGLAVHDLGGPIGLHWAAQQPPGRVERLALLNTLLYPRMNWAVMAFVASCWIPGARALLASPWGLKTAMRLGVSDPRRLRPDTLEGTCAPFRERAARKALLKAGRGLSPKGMVELSAWLSTVKVPVRLLYGANDKILPNIAWTMARAQRELPHAELTRIDDCGHFLQEDRPEQVAEALAAFFR